MPTNYWFRELPERQHKLKQRVREAQGKVEDGLTYAFERLLQERMDTYFIMEERLEEFYRLFANLVEEIDATLDESSFRRLEARLDYLEDSFEEIDSEMRGRPARRRRRKFNFFNFFRQWQSDQERSPQGCGEIKDAGEAYQILGLSVGTDLSAVKGAFRKLVKDLHPDARDGDRSQEPRLRKLVAAYQFIKQQFLQR